MPRKKPKAVPTDVRIAWLGEMAVMTRAGIAAADAASRVAQGMKPPARAAASATARRLANGRSLAEAAVADGLVDPADGRVLSAGEMSGKVPELLQRLADGEERARSVRRTIRSRMMMPVLVLAIALFVAPIPDLVAGRIDVGDYLARSLGTAVMLMAIGFVVIRGIAAARAGGGLKGALANLELRLPLIGDLQRRRNQLGLLDRLALMQAAGVPLPDAMRESAHAMRNVRMRADLADAPSDLEAGRTVSDVLGEWGWMDHSVHALIQTGESAGRLEQTLEQVATTERARLEDDDRQVGEWVPRIFYFTIGAWMVSRIMGGGF